MLPKTHSDITRNALQLLVDDEVPEGKFIEYKKGFYQLDLDESKSRAQQHEELLKDISSFANADGGDLIIGMAAKDGIASDLCGFELPPGNPNFDSLLLRIADLVRGGIQPRIGYSEAHVDLGDGRFALVLRIPKSNLSPHRVVHRQIQGKFWSRSTNGAFEMDTAQLKQAFLSSSTAVDRMMAFRRERIDLLSSQTFPVPVVEDSLFVIHFLPVASFSSDVSYSAFELKKQMKSLPLLVPGLIAHSSRPNFDGVVSFFAQGEPIGSTGYVQAFRNGVVEVLSDSIIEKSQAQSGKVVRYFQTAYVRYCLNRFSTYMEFFRELNVPLPIWMCVSLLGVRGAAIVGGPPGFAKAIDRDVLLVPEIEILDFDADSKLVFQPVFDMIWNAGGHLCCPDLDQQIVGETR